MDLSEIAGQVLFYCLLEQASLGDDPTQVERVVSEQVRRIGARAVGLHLAGRKLGYRGSARPGACGEVQRFVDRRRKTVQTLPGRLTIRRAYDQCTTCKSSAIPDDSAVGLGRGPASSGVARAAALLNVQDPFERAGRTLAKLTGQRLAERTVERLSEVAGAQAAPLEGARAAALREWRAPPVWTSALVRSRRPAKTWSGPE